MSRWSLNKKSGTSKTQYMKFKGLVSYCRPYEPDEFRGATNWKMNLHPTAESMKAIKAAGIQLEVKDKPAENIDEKDAKHLTFKRPVSRKFGQKETLFCPPEVLIDGKSTIYYTVNGKKADTYEEGDDVERVGEPILIGNGSEVEIEVEVWHGSMGVGNRWKRVNVLDLIEYTPPEEVDENTVDGEEVDDEPPFDVDEKPAPKKTTKKSGVDW